MYNIIIVELDATYSTEYCVTVLSVYYSVMHAYLTVDNNQMPVKVKTN